MCKEDFVSKYKFGDIIRIRNWVIIYAGLRKSRSLNGSKWAILKFSAMAIGSSSHYVSISSNNPTTGIGCVEDLEYGSVRPATNYEKEYVHKTLRRHGCRWDEETMRLEHINNNSQL